MTLNEQQLKHLKTWQASGLSQRYYCQVNGLNKHAFSEWFSAYKALNHYMSPALIVLEYTPLVTWLEAANASALPDPSKLRRD
jgi:hypothetical protein